MRGLSTPTRAWLALMVATAGSVWLGEHQLGWRWALGLILLIAVFKTRLVFLHFMELAKMPPPWRWVFEAWALGCAAMMFMLYSWH